MEKCCFKANVVFFISHLYRKKWKNMVYFFHRVTTKILTKRTNILLKFVGHVHQNYLSFQDFNRYRRKRPKVDASIFDSALSHSRRSDASEKIEENSVSTFGRFRLWTSFQSSHLSVNQSRQGGTNVPPDFQNSSKKIISHRFRVIKV